MMALTVCFHYSISVTVNRFDDIFPLLVLSVTVTVNLNHTVDESDVGMRPITAVW